MEYLNGEDNVWADILSRWANPDFGNLEETKVVKSKINNFRSNKEKVTRKRSIKELYNRSDIINKFLHIK